MCTNLEMCTDTSYIAQHAPSDYGVYFIVYKVGAHPKSVAETTHSSPCSWKFLSQIHFCTMSCMIGRAYDYIASLPGSPSSCAINPRMTFDPSEIKVEG